MNKPFVAEQFVPTKHSSAEDKARFANHFVRFAASGFKETLFPEWFYRRLSMTFGHIAHGSRSGFYGTFFTTPEGRLRFAELTARGGYGGDPEYTYSDVETAIKDWVHNYRLVEKMRAGLNADDIKKGGR